MPPKAKKAEAPAPKEDTIDDAPAPTKRGGKKAAAAVPVGAEDVAIPEVNEPSASTSTRSTKRGKGALEKAEEAESVAEKEKPARGGRKKKEPEVEVEEKEVAEPDEPKVDKPARAQRRKKEVDMEVELKEPASPKDVVSSKASAMHHTRSRKASPKDELEPKHVADKEKKSAQSKKVPAPKKAANHQSHSDDSEDVSPKKSEPVEEKGPTVKPKGKPVGHAEDSDGAKESPKKSESVPEKQAKGGAKRKQAMQSESEEEVMDAPSSKVVGHQGSPDESEQNGAELTKADGKKAAPKGSKAKPKIGGKDKAVSEEKQEVIEPSQHEKFDLGGDVFVVLEKNGKVVKFTKEKSSENNDPATSDFGISKDQWEALKAMTEQLDKHFA